MAKFGQLFLKKGRWNGEQLISEEWCTESTSEHIDPNDFSASYTWCDGYGYQWWQKDYTYDKKVFHTYFALGWGGQQITMIHELETVIVLTGGNWYTSEKISCHNLIEDYIIPALPD